MCFILSGARIVASVPGNSKVVIQLPRGNLETFEPRPLVLMRARQLMDQGHYFDCVVLLRRQKVDLNYVVDYNPAQFLLHCAAFVSKAVVSNADLVSLLISALEPHTLSLRKYAYQRLSVNQLSQPPEQQDDAIDGTAAVAPTAADIASAEPLELSGAQKVNTVCEALRNELLKIIRSGTAPASAAALNPALCSYAKQMPPLLAEALGLVDSLYCPGGASSASRSNVLASSKVQSAIKYLSFLAEGPVMFDAALGMYKHSFVVFTLI